MNFSAFGFGDFATLNFLKMATSPSAPSYNFLPILSSDAYPTATPATAINYALTTMPTADNPRWDFYWTGTAKVVLSASGGTPTINSDPGSCATAGSGSITISGTNCIVGFTWASAPSSWAVQFPASGTFSNISNMVLVRDDEKALLDSGEIFRPQFLSKLSGMGLNTLRFEAWNSTIADSFQSRYSYLNSTTSFSYAAGRWAPGAIAGDCGSGAGALCGTDTYTAAAATDTPGSYTDGEVIQAFAVNANTSTTPTLNVAGRGAKTIVNHLGNAISAGTISANSKNSFIYNGILGKWLLFSGQAMNVRVPLSVMVALCNKLNMSLWFNVPPMWDNASMASATAYVRDNLNSNLSFYVEWSNENWNSSFSQYVLEGNIGAALGFPTATFGPLQQGLGYWALRLRQLWPVVATNWSPRTSGQLIRLIAFSGEGAMSSTEVNSYLLGGHDLTLDASGNYCNGGGCTIVTDYTSAPNRPVDFADGLAYATYYSGAQIANASGSYANTMTDAITAADNYASGNPTLMASALDFVDCDVRGVVTVAFPNCGKRNGTLGSFTLANLAATFYPQWESTAATFNKPVFNYEGGYEGTAPLASRLTTLGITTCAGGNNTLCATEFANLITAYKNDARFTQLVYDQMKQAIVQPHSRMPSWYELGPSQGTAEAQWVVFGGPDINTAPYKSYDGIGNFAFGR